MYPGSVYLGPLEELDELDDVFEVSPPPGLALLISLPMPTTPAASAAVCNASVRGFGFISVIAAIPRVLSALAIQWGRRGGVPVSIQRQLGHFFLSTL